MSAPLRSEGWSVRPSFVAHGPTSPVTLLADDTGLTQLAGVPPVAWQTPWEELFNVQLVRIGRGLALFATVAGVRYCWRTSEARDFEALSNVIQSHGGHIIRKRRRAEVYLVAAVVLLASLAGGVAALFGNSKAHELSAARSVNLTLKDLPGGWTTASNSMLTDLFTPNQVVDSATPTTSTTAPSAQSLWSHVTSQFQHCMGVSNAKDRVYGAAGHEPDYQVTSDIFASPSLRGVNIASSTQYYASTSMVKRDTAEMSSPKFGACFVASSAAILLGINGDPTAKVSATNWQPPAYVHGWSRGGVATLNLTGLAGPLDLVMVEATRGHFEVEVGALVGSFADSKSLIANAVTTLLSRITSTSSTPV